MVYSSSSDDVIPQKSQNFHAPLFSRFFSALLDYFILAPVVAFFLVIFFRDSVQIVSRSSSVESHTLLVQLAIFAILLFTGLQTVFIYFYGSTPGQSFLKLYVSFEQKPSNLFLQIWFRQIGFVGSVACLGLPFLAIIYHHRNRAFYDRLNECDILSLIPSDENPAVINPQLPLAAFTVHEVDKKYLSTAISTLTCFGTLIFIFSMLQSHLNLLEKIQVTENEIAAPKKCFVIEDQTQEQRLKSVLALNILNIATDDCALNEADEVFNSLKTSQTTKKKNNQVALAYFVKYYISQKAADQKLNQEKYLKMACGQGIKSDLCEVTKDRQVASTDSNSAPRKDLKNKLLDYIGKVK